MNCSDALTSLTWLSCRFSDLHPLNHPQIAAAQMSVTRAGRLPHLVNLLLFEHESLELVYVMQYHMLPLTANSLK
jgi:hypothetical protein